MGANCIRPLGKEVTKMTGLGIQPPAIEAIEQGSAAWATTRLSAKKGLKVLGTVSLGLIGIWALAGVVLLGMFLFAILVR